jgi:6-phosphogluconolactonase
MIRRFPTAAALAEAAADDFALGVSSKPGEFHVALSGGSTPKTLFDVLAKRADQIWDRVHLWWGDERCVLPTHPDSNYGMTKQHLIDPLGLDPARVHRIPAERDPERAAADYEAELVRVLGAPPVFDLIWLGMGPDGHTASLFPGSAGLTETERYVIANHVDSPLTKGPATRITLTVPASNAARAVRFLVAGADKADTLAAVLAGPPGKFPSQLIANPSWFVDDAAAAKLGAAP